MRVITLVVNVAKNIYLLSIYDKSEQGDITSKELDQLVIKVM